MCARRKTNADWSWLSATAADGRTESVRAALRTAILDGTLPDELIEQLVRGSHALVRPRVPRVGHAQRA